MLNYSKIRRILREEFRMAIDFIGCRHCECCLRCCFSDCILDDEEIYRDICRQERHLKKDAEIHNKRYHGGLIPTTNVWRNNKLKTDKKYHDEYMRKNRDWCKASYQNSIFKHKCPCCGCQLADDYKFKICPNCLAKKRLAKKKWLAKKAAEQRAYMKIEREKKYEIQKNNRIRK
jgi:hypothetical protein